VPVTAPVWLRLERSGDEFVGEFSVDGETWTEVGRHAVAIGASTRRREMNETSIVARVTGSGRVAAVIWRAFVRSIETTRGSLRASP
jgi:hypothetical protein